MANTKISALPTFTGNTTGVYLVMDSADLSQTYKVVKEDLISGGTSGTSGSSGSSGTSGVSGGYLKLTQLVDNVPATSRSGSAIVTEWTSTYTSQTNSTLMFTISFTSFSSTGGLKQFDILIDSVVVASSSFYFNTINEHTTIPCSFNVESLSAGSHTIQIRIPAGVTVDGGDFAHVSVIETMPNLYGPAFSAYNSLATALSTTPVKIDLQTEEFDTNNNFASSQFTPTLEGYYLMTGSVMVPTSSTFVSAMLYKNGSKISDGPSAPCGSFFYNSSLTSKLVYMNGTTDYIELWAIANGSVNTYPATTSTYLNGFWARGA